MGMGQEYVKHNEAIALLETDGYTKDVPDGAEARIIYKDADLDTRLRLSTGHAYKRELRRLR